MAKRRRYSDEFRASAVLMLEAAGYPDKRGSLTAVANKIDVPARTISRWFNKEQNEPPDKLVNEKRAELVVRIEEIAHMFLDAINEDVETNGVDGVKAMTALGIAVDKLQLLSGKPTERTEVLDPDARRERITQLFETARTRRTGDITA